MSTLPSSQRAEVDRLERIALGVGVVSLLACVLGALLSPAQFFRAYLTAYQFYLGLPLGCMAIVMVYHLTGGAWGFLIRRLLEAGMRTLPLVAILFIPIACGLGYLYLWAWPEIVAVNKNLQGKMIYFNLPFLYPDLPSFWWLRAVLYFIVWLTIASFLNRWSAQQDETGSPLLPRKFRLLSAPGLVIYGLTITFASVDWVMSLQPTFHSTIFPPLFAVGQMLSGLAFAIVVLGWLITRPPLAKLFAVETFIDLGNLLFTFLIIWAYLAFFQFMLVWMANLPEEVIWYQPRGQGGWQWVAGALFVLHFAVPFFLLLSRDIKRNPPALAAVAGLLLFMQLVYMYFQILPPFSGPAWQRLLSDFPADHLSVHWMDFLTPLGIGGLWLAYFLWQLKRCPVLPLHDLSREEAVHLRQRALEEAARQEAIRHG